ncbi:MAG: alginate lyase family protein [Rikenellaceae bacterium]
MKPTLLLSAAILTTTLCATNSCSSQEPKPEVKGPAIWNIDNINLKASRIAAGEKIDFYEALKADADSILLVDVNPSVMFKPHAPISGDKHDYMSLSRYWWPNPDTESGLPYVRHDGRSNPELKAYDRSQLSKFSESINTLSLVYYISGEQKYADKAISRLRTWFIDPETRMNPNLAYAQIRKGHNDDKGSHSGLLDGFSFVTMLDAVSLLEIKETLPKGVQDSMQMWFADLSEWMLTSENGIAESNANNNHAVAYDTQVIRYAMYGGRDSVARAVINAFPERRMATQIEEDGRMPAELARTIAFFYTRYNIEHMIDICEMASKLGIELYPANQYAIERAIEWMLPHSTDPDNFPYEQINSWQSVQQSFARLLYRASKYGNEERYKAYYNEHKAEQENPLFEFLYL